MKHLTMQNYTALAALVNNMQLPSESLTARELRQLSSKHMLIIVDAKSLKGVSVPVIAKFPQPCRVSIFPAYQSPIHMG